MIQRPSAPLKILLVEDDPDDQMFFQTALKKVVDSYILETFADPVQAKSKIVSDNYDVIFLDIHLPKQNGLDLLGEIRRTIPGSTRIYMLTTSTNPEDAAKAKNYGADGFYTKDVDIRELQKTISRSLSPVM